ncbi:hypothetical protein EV186_106474 [Labedaea rhizosphaerae]|uniref:Circularly permuted ATP-grasp superfamily protein n=1 Tax=Labedaea rhizosphaerae TaxID=598644 RepID=A0A4R6S383_LABRH|nr:hypothetical protein EV186_106474 [Labedaea rhizosphaerae]
MSTSADYRAAVPHHNAITDSYLAEFAKTGIRPSELKEAVRESTEDTTFQGRSLSRPVFLTKAQVTLLADDLERLHSALTGLPDRMFGGDMAAFAHAVGTTAEQAAAAVRGRMERPPRIGRADFFLDETGFKLMEINWGSAVGGLDSGPLNKAMLAQPFVGDFVREHGLTYVDPMEALVDTLLTECAIPAGTRPVVALTDWPKSFEKLEPQLHKSAAGLAPLGLDCYPCHVGQLEYRDGAVWLGERKIDVVYRLFLMEDLMDPTGPGLIEPVLRAAERGEVGIFAPMDAELYGSKGALALLSDEANRHLYSVEELAALDRILPWTRMVRPGPVTVDGSSVELTDYALANRTELILKPTLMHAGQGVLPGWTADAGTWQDAVRDAMGEPFVLQRRVRSVPEVFPTDDGSEEWTLTWGAFMVSKGYGGMFMRGTLDPNATVNMATGATGTCCFHEA